MERSRLSGVDTLAIAGYATVALLVELVVLRLVTRTAIHVPGLGAVEPGIRLISEIGRIAFYAAAVLLPVLIVAMAINAWLAARWSLVIVLAGLVGVVVVAPTGWLAESVVDVVTVGAVLAAPLFGIRSADRPFVSFVPSSLFAVAFAVAAIPTVVSKVRPGATLPVVGLLAAAEVLAIVAAMSTLLCVRGRPRRRSVIVAGIASVTISAMLAYQPSTVEVLMLWNFGLAGYLHPIAYGLAGAACALAACESILRRTPAVALGISFVVAGGVGLHSTLQSAAFVVGVLILADPGVLAMAPDRPTSDGTRGEIPVVDGHVPEGDLANDRIVVDLPSGLFG
ncbi:MAG: hypothetical protein KDB69_03065 [Acidimicrobiia bacterium]|nr:hypothetical protein [Acidimicrobiia bacterium]